MSEERINYVTEEGLKAMQEEYEHLVHVDREEVKRELAEARAMGDLSENADYDAARDKQSQIEAKIQELEYKLGHYELIDTTNADKSVVNIGSAVTLEFMDTKEVETYRIIGSQEADPLNGKLSNETPLAKAVLNHKIGETVSVNAKVPYKVKIVEISQEG